MSAISSSRLISLAILIGVLTVVLQSKVTLAEIHVEANANEVDEELVREERNPKLYSETFAEAGCPNVNPASNLKMKWLTKTAAWFVPMGHAYYYHRWVERLTNKSSGANDIANLCLKIMFMASKKPNMPYMVVGGGLKRSAMYKCLATGPHNQNCDGVQGAPDYTPGIDAYETVVATDNDKYMLILRCIRNKFKSWFIMTRGSDDLTPAVQKVVMEHINKMGFDLKKASLLPYGACPKGGVDPRKG